MQDTAFPAATTPVARLVDRLAGLAIAVAALALLGLVAVQGWQVVARYALNDSPSWTEPVTLLLLIWGMNGITLIYAITRGGPANLSLITPIQIYQLAFESFQFNEAAALSVLLFIIAAIMVAIYLKVIPSSREDSR